MPEIRTYTNDGERYIYVDLCPKCIREQFRDDPDVDQDHYWLVDMDRGNHCKNCLAQIERGRDDDDNLSI